ncbi:MAG: radical SAM protein [Campylobacter sp.]|nr:radical SAM protein [Campylobacter sp.]
MSVIFGPINSRRFGMSLGIDLSPDEKTCNFDCVYCELKAAKPKYTIANPPEVNLIISELKKALEHHPNVDVITLTANGEPTLYPHLKELILSIKKLNTGKKLLILSNASGVLDPKISEALLMLDIVKFSLDSAVQSTFSKIGKNKNIINVDELINALKNFRFNFKGKLVLEILVVAGFNDTKFEFEKLNEAIDNIVPNRVDISTIDRPPAYPVNGVSNKVLQNLSTYITTAPTLIVKAHTSYEVYDFTREEILEILSRRPQSTTNIKENFSNKSQKILKSLLASGEVYESILAGVKFYRTK